VLFIRKQLNPAGGHMVLLIPINLVPFIEIIKKKTRNFDDGKLSLLHFTVSVGEEKVAWISYEGRSRIVVYLLHWIALFSGLFTVRIYILIPYVCNYRWQVPVPSCPRYRTTCSLHYRHTAVWSSNLLKENMGPKFRLKKMYLTLCLGKYCLCNTSDIVDVK